MAEKDSLAYMTSELYKDTVSIGSPARQSLDSRGDFGSSQ